MPDPTESDLVKRLRTFPLDALSPFDYETIKLAASALSRAEQDIEALVKALYEMRNAASYERVFTSLPPHLAKRIKESGR